MRIGRIRIGAWVLDRSDGTLTREHSTVRLEPKVLAVLLHLVERQGDVVTHEDLLRDVWKDTHVVAGALARAVSLLRTAFDDDAYHPSYIETVPKRGYRLIAEVEELPPVVARYAPAARLFAAAATVVVLVLLVSQPGGKAYADWTWKFSHSTRVGNETAFEHYSRAVDQDPSSAEAHAGLATVFVFRSHYLPDHDRWAAAAVASANRALSLDAGSAAAARAAGMAYLEVGKFTEAEAHYRRALDLRPGDHNTRLNLGWTLTATGNVEAAVEIIRPRVTEMPDALGYAYLAEALWLAGRLSEAIAAARTAAEFEPFARQPQLLLIRSELISANRASAQSRLQRLLQAYPDCSQCVAQLGLIEQLADNFSVAEARYREAIAMPSPPPGASLRLAHVLTVTGRHTEAATVLQGVEEAATRELTTTPHWMPRWTLAAAAAIRGDRRQSLTWFREAVGAGRRDAAWDAFEPMFDGVRPLSASIASAQSADPIVGTWKLNLAKSQYPIPAPKSTTLTVAPAERGWTLTVDAIGPDGQAQKWGYTSAFDGAESPIIGNPMFDAAISRSNGTVGTVQYKKGGKIITTTSSLISDDGKTMTVTLKVPDGKGSELTIISVYDKQ
jgi:transcriptional activator of cad operon